MRLPKPPRRGPKPRQRIVRHVRLRAYRKGKTADVRAELKRLWSHVVLQKNGGRCVLAGEDIVKCGGPMDPAHAWPKGACPQVRYDPDMGEPVCRRHHQTYGNGLLWRIWLRGYWTPKVYEARDRAAHVSGGRVDYEAAKAKLEATA